MHHTSLPVVPPLTIIYSAVACHEARGCQHSTGQLETLQWGKCTETTFAATCLQSISFHSCSNLKVDAPIMGQSILWIDKIKLMWKYPIIGSVYCTL